MIKKAFDYPEDLKNLLVDERKELVPIGSNVYEIYPLPVRDYFKLYGLLGRYFKVFNKTLEEGKDLSVGELVSKVFEDPDFQEEFKEFFSSVFPEIKSDIEKMTGDQFQFLLGVLYKQNFLSKTENEKAAEMINLAQQLLGLRQT